MPSAIASVARPTVRTASARPNAPKPIAAQIKTLRRLLATPAISVRPKPSTVTAGHWQVKLARLAKPEPVAATSLLANINGRGEGRGLRGNPRLTQRHV